MNCFGLILALNIYLVHFKFIGKIRLPESLEWSKKKAIVDAVIENLGLRKCENTGTILFFKSEDYFYLINLKMCG